MQKIALKCDLCDAPLVMQAGGKFAKCEYCGMTYAIERLREKLQNIKLNVSFKEPVKVQNADFEIHAGVLTKYHGSDTKIIVPDGVKEIGHRCFANMKYLTSVTLPYGLKKIEASAFEGCTSLTSITIPNSVTEIQGSAFKGCSSLTSINIPNSVTTIGDSSWGGHTFAGCSNLRSVTVSDSILAIPKGAFCGCTSLTSITIPNSVTAIGNSAFEGCTSLTSITIPNSVTSIGYDAFKDCTSLRNINIPDSVIEIGTHAFRNCPIDNLLISSSTEQRLLGSLSSDYNYNNYGSLWNGSLWKAFSHDKTNINISPYYYCIAKQGWKRLGRCQYCGGKFTGLFSKQCSRCNSPKDY